jgi:septum site-determining protein MinC
MAISFKGTREGIAVTLGDGDWRQTMKELATQLARPQTQTFFRGARVLLETGHRAIEVAQLEELIALLSQNNMTLSSVSGERRSQEAFAQMRQALPPPVTTPKIETPTDGAPAILLHRPVRSGQRYRYVGTIIVIGDVNPGAELIAEGDVIVWGKLRGVVHAGAAGNEHSLVGALVLAPTQLRIGRYIARAPDLNDKRTHALAAEVARVRDGNIVVEPWNG